jgi:hypothetical protein
VAAAILAQVSCASVEVSRMLGVDNVADGPLFANKILRHPGYVVRAVRHVAAEVQVQNHILVETG